jgi:hypothetical protein
MKAMGRLAAPMAEHMRKCLVWLPQLRPHEKEHINPRTPRYDNLGATWTTWLIRAGKLHLPFATSRLGIYPPTVSEQRSGNRARGANGPTPHFGK